MAFEVTPGVHHDRRAKTRDEQRKEQAEPVEHERELYAQLRHPRHGGADRFSGLDRGQVREEVPEQRQRQQSEDPSRGPSRAPDDGGGEEGNGEDEKNGG